MNFGQNLYQWFLSNALFMGMAGKNITENRKEGAKEMQKTEEFCLMY